MRLTNPFPCATVVDIVLAVAPFKIIHPIIALIFILVVNLREGWRWVGDENEGNKAMDVSTFPLAFFIQSYGVISVWHQMRLDNLPPLELYTIVNSTEIPITRLHPTKVGDHIIAFVAGDVFPNFRTVCHHLL